MKVKIYLNEWFYNAGIIGFLRIIKHSKVNFVQKGENFIEFDIENLRNFDKLYFQYFYDIYNIAEKLEKRTIKSFEKIENYIRKLGDNPKDKQIQEELKQEKNNIKQALKTQLDKIKKIDEKIYAIMYESYNKIDLIKKIEDLDTLVEIQKKILECLYKDKINKRTTMNSFKSVLNKGYFGQTSFLNVLKSACEYEEQEKIMYKDFVSNIVETGFLQDILQGKYNLQEIQNYIEKQQNEGILTTQVAKVYSNIQKQYINKGKQLEHIQSYIKDKVLSHCCMCECDNTMTNNYSESNFVPLAISSENMANFFWNQNVKFPICDLCKLIMFCIPAGITSITKIVKENEKGKNEYREKEIYSFVNYDTNVESLLKVNDNFAMNSKVDKQIINPYSELILNIVEQDKKISEWQLQNIFIVEFESEYLAYSRMEYFHIPKYVARFLKEYSNKSLNQIKDYKYKLQLMEYILKNKDIHYVVNDRLREELKNEKQKGYNSYIAIQIRLILNLLKRGGKEVNKDIEQNNKKLYAIYSLGNDIHEELKAKGEENKLSGYTYKMLNSIKAGNKKEFMDIVIRIHISMGKDVSPIFLEIMQEDKLDLSSIGHSFISGLISDKYYKKEEENV